MNIFNAVHAVCAISKMTQPQFTRKSYFFFKPVFILKLIFSFFLSFNVFLTDFLEEVGNGLGFYGTITTDIPKPWLLINLDIGNSSSILTTIVLLFHEDVHLVHGVSCAIFFDVIGERLSQ